MKIPDGYERHVAADRPPWLRCKRCGSEFDGVFTHEKFLREHDAVCIGRNNVTREVAETCGVELTHYEQWTDEQKIRHDRLVYGTAFARRRSDGSLEHIPTLEMMVFMNDLPPKGWP
jgi:hypothetical protein